LHHNDPGFGIVVYNISGTFDGSRLSIKGSPQSAAEGLPQEIKATGMVAPTGNLQGEWESDIGAAGTFELYPHDRPLPASVAVPDQVHTARHNFGPIEIDREQIIALATDIQKVSPRAGSSSHS
jgi:hypothetical protein